MGVATAALMFFAPLTYFFVHAMRVRKSFKRAQLPCTTCGDPMDLTRDTPCPECASTTTRSEAIEIWKSHNLVNPFPIQIEQTVAGYPDPYG